MGLETLPPNELELLRRCLAFIATTPLLEDEFETRLGISRSEVAAVLMRWPPKPDRITDLAVHNTLNELLRGLELTPEDWNEINGTRSEILQLESDWRAQASRHL